MPDTALKHPICLVYVDFGPTINVTEGQSPIISVHPKKIEPLIRQLTDGATKTKRFFLHDTRLIPLCKGDMGPHNEILTQWEDFDYEGISCPRAGALMKESIDPKLIQKVNNDVRFFSDEMHPIHVILVVGDVDYRPLITSLLDQGVIVSLLASRPHASLRSGIMERLHKCIPLYPVNERTDARFPNFNAVQKAVNTGDPVYLQSHYSPTREMYDTALMFDATTFACPYCSKTIFTGHRSSHFCKEGSRPSNPPPGLITEEYLYEQAIRFSSFSQKELLDWLMVSSHNRVLPSCISMIAAEAPSIPWKNVELIRMAYRIMQTMDEGIPSSSVPLRGEIKELLHAGIIQLRDDTYAATDIAQILQPLIVEIEHRIDPQRATQQIFTKDEGALTIPLLRNVVVNALSKPATETNGAGIQEPTEENLWDSDTALFYLTQDPHLSVLADMESIDVHPVNAWKKRLLSIKTGLTTPKQDMLVLLEEVLRENPFATPLSPRILIQNGVLSFDPENQTLSLEKEHELFSACPLSQRAVA